MKTTLLTALSSAAIADSEIVPDTVPVGALIDTLGAALLGVVVEPVALLVNVTLRVMLFVLPSVPIASAFRVFVPVLNDRVSNAQRYGAALAVLTSRVST